MNKEMWKKVGWVAYAIIVLGLLAGIGQSLWYGHYNSVYMSVLVVGALMITVFITSIVASVSDNCKIGTIIISFVYLAMLFVGFMWHNGNFDYYSDTLIVHRGNKYSVVNSAFVFPGTISSIESIKDVSFEMPAEIKTEKFEARWIYKIKFYSSNHWHDIFLIMERFGSVKALNKELKRIFEESARAGVANFTLMYQNENGIKYESDLYCRLSKEADDIIREFGFLSDGIAAVHLRQAFIMPSQ